MILPRLYTSLIASVLVAGAQVVLGAPQDWIKPVDPDTTPHRAALASLVNDMLAGRIDTLIVLDANPAYAVGNGQYKYFVGPSCYYSTTDAGIITAGPLKGTTFTPQGQPEPFAYGTNLVPANNALLDSGGTCSKQHSMYVPSTTPPIHRQNAYTRVQYDINDNTNVYAEALYAHGTAYNQAWNLNATNWVTNNTPFTASTFSLFSRTTFRLTYDGASVNDRTSTAQAVFGTTVRDAAGNVPAGAFTVSCSTSAW